MVHIITQLILWIAVGAAFFRTLRAIGVASIDPSLVGLDGTLVVVCATLVMMVCAAVPLLGMRLYHVRVASVPVWKNKKQALIGLLATILCNVVAYLLFFHALRIGEFSVVTAFRNTVPIFSIVIGALFLKERIAPIGWLGALITVLGVFVIFDVLNPQSVSSNAAGATIALVCAVIWAFAIMFDRVALAPDRGGYDLGLFICTVQMGMCATYALMLFSMGKLGAVSELILAFPYEMIGTGVAGMIGIYLTGMAIMKDEIGVVAPLLRIQVLFSILAGVYVFDESHPYMRIMGGLILIGGIALVLLRDRLQPKAA